MYRCPLATQIMLLATYNQSLAYHCLTAAGVWFSFLEVDGRTASFHSGPVEIDRRWYCDHRNR